MSLIAFYKSNGTARIKLHDVIFKKDENSNFNLCFDLYTSKTSSGYDIYLIVISSLLKFTIFDFY